MTLQSAAIATACGVYLTPAVGQDASTARKCRQLTQFFRRLCAASDSRQHSVYLCIESGLHVHVYNCSTTRKHCTLGMTVTAVDG